MRLNRWFTCFSLGLAVMNCTAFADTAPAREQLQVPQCLAAKITSDYTVLAENKQFKIIEMLSSEVDSLRILADSVRCGHFINVSHKITANQLITQKQSAQRLLEKKTALALKTGSPVSEHYEIKHQREVNAAINTIDSEHIWQTLTHLTSFSNRSATKDTGVEAANWLKSRFEKMVVLSGRKDVDTYFVKTGWYKQPSLVTVIGKNINAPAVVIGAHMDTLDGNMPGAGDDGSGSSTVMELARVLLNSPLTFKHPIYIVWYSAEERGLVGSQYVVDHFLENYIPVKAVVQFDMTGYRADPNDPTMWVYTDYTNKDLNDYVAKLISTYVKVPVDYSACGYGCSDHASWTEEGFPSAFPCETNFEDHNPYIHTPSDTMSLLSLEHMTNFTKLAVAFAIELAS